MIYLYLKKYEMVSILILFGCHRNNHSNSFEKKIMIFSSINTKSITIAHLKQNFYCLKMKNSIFNWKKEH